MTTTGFWSYVNADDAAEGGRIKALADDIAAQYEAITTESIEIFVDKSSLGWGDDWEEKIERAVLTTSFFVPVLTPRYFASESCRRELRLFANKAANLGLDDLIMPLIWLDVPQLDDPSPTDDLVAIAKRFHWTDWRSLRFEEQSSGTYRRAVAELARRLADVSARVSASVPLAAELPSGGALLASSVDAGDDDSELGSLDKLVASEEAMPAWTETVGEIQTEIVAISAITEEATGQVEASNSKTNPMAARLRAVRNYANELEPHAQRIEELGNEFTTHLYNVDGGLRMLLTQALEVTDEQEVAAAKELAASIIGMASSSREGLGALQEMVVAIEPIEGLSRDLRAPLKKLRRGLTVMYEGQHVIDEWKKLAEEVRTVQEGAA
jgi:TIR domain